MTLFRVSYKDRYGDQNHRWWQSEDSAVIHAQHEATSTVHPVIVGKLELKCDSFQVVRTLNGRAEPETIYVFGGEESAKTAAGAKR